MVKINFVLTGILFFLAEPRPCAIKREGQPSLEARRNERSVIYDAPISAPLTSTEILRVPQPSGRFPRASPRFAREPILIIAGRPGRCRLLLSPGADIRAPVNAGSTYTHLSSPADWSMN